MNNKFKKSHIVKRAIIMAAGIGKRMQPLTFTIPKPLVKVNGVRMIDTVIEGLLSNGITEIYIVVGYLKEQFSFLQTKYSEIVFIENPYYADSNNISSLYVACEHLQDCIILDGDQIINNPEVLSPEFELSGYNAVWCENDTKEWLMQINEEGIVQSCSRAGGSRGWQLYSISRWTAEDGKKLQYYLKTEFERGNRQIYWDDVAMFCYFDKFMLGIKKMEVDDVIEVDSFDELIALDPSYKKNFEKGGVADASCKC